MNHKERFRAFFTGQPVDRAPFWLHWGPWGTAWARWIEEGKPEEITDHRSFMHPDPPPQIVPVNCGPCPRLEVRLLEEANGMRTWVDTWGIKRRNPIDHESMSEFLEFPVKDRADWERFRDELLEPEHPDRMAGNWREVVAEWTKNDIPIQLGYFPDVGIFGSVRWLLGDEECLMAFATAPDLVHDIMEHMTSLYLHVFGQVVQECQVDVIHIWEDMCGRQGPLIGPDMWREYMGPCYRRIKAFADANDIPVLSVDTDGQPDLIVPPMMEAGVNMLFPFEVAAGCDVNDFGERYPTLGMMGGIDKRVLAEDPEAIDRELERVRPAFERGLYLPDLDHLIPDDVSWKNYEHYAHRLKEMFGGASE